MTIIKTAAILIIGDEILSGRTHDSNTRDLAQKLGDAGITVREARVIPDVIDTIVAVVNDLRRTYDYVFTTGGIGPTHDDKTAEAIAKAFDTRLERHPAAWDALVRHIGGEHLMNEGRAKMALIPVGATLIDNPVSSAPGFAIENVYVMAGVPKIMNAMADGLIPRLAGGDKIISHTLEYNLAESIVAPLMESAERNNPNLTIGSYPRFVPQGQKLAIVLRSTDAGLVERVSQELDAAIKTLPAYAASLSAPPSTQPSSEVDSLKARNARVELDKAWETSKTRRAIIAGITYIVVALYLPMLGVQNSWLHALVPVAGYLLSTLGLPYAKALWIQRKN